MWPEDTDKMGKRWRCPINSAVRQAIESALHKLQRLGHVTAEKLARLAHVKGLLYHAHRRLWATARKNLPT